ncbi:MAG TPA: serine/threonine-protein kinase [Kofleriaceae bacterium]|nr:serine/threonine-protein kinase [Kofleriaceae bacterium]
MAHYELGERIAVGGMAEIFRGKATAGGGFEKPVAIKRILPHLSQDKRFVSLLITEAKTLSQLRHRNVVQIYDVGLGDDGQYFLVMEFVDGMDLGRLYESLEGRSRRLPLDVALYITGEVCEALEHAHQARGEDGEPIGLVHRDVSPSNVLLSRSGEVKLTDFGIAKRTEEATGHGGVRGKFAYISPEQAHNRRVDARSDVYSVAILLFELVTGHRLFSDLPDFDALRAVREGRLPRPRDIDPSIDAELERILLTGLAPRPEDRFPSAGTLGAQLRTCRYSLVSTVADPAVEISRMIEEYAGGSKPEHQSPVREPSVVRISTVAGFSGSFEVPDEPTGTVTGELSLPPPPLGLDEEEETRAVNVSGLDTRRDTPPPMQERARLGKRDRGLQFQPAPDLSDVEAIAEAETRVMDYRPELFPELAAADDRASPVVAVSHDEPAGPHASPPDPVPAPPPSLAHASTPSLAHASTSTLRQVFYNGALNEDPRDANPVPPPIPPGPILSIHLLTSRRRTLLLAGGTAVVLGVLSFVIAGAFMSGNTPAPTPSTSGTAGAQPNPAPSAPVDTPAPLPAPAPPTTEASSATPERPPKRKHKRPPKKRVNRTSSDKKRSATSKR